MDERRAHRPSRDAKNVRALAHTRDGTKRKQSKKARARPRCNNRAARRSGGDVVVRRGATCAHASQPRLLFASEGPDSFFLGVVIVARDPAAAFLAALHGGEAPLSLLAAAIQGPPQWIGGARTTTLEASREMTASLGNDAPSVGVAMFLLLCSAAMLVFFFLGSGRPVPFRSTRRRRFHWLAKKKPNEQQVEECEESDPPKHREEEACFAERAVSLSNGTCCRQRGKALSPFAPSLREERHKRTADHSSCHQRGVTMMRPVARA